MSPLDDLNKPVSADEFFNTDLAARKISDFDYAAAAQLVPCDEPTIRTVVQVEAGSEGYLSDGRPKILYEAHYFGHLTQHRFAQYSNISAYSWDRSLYGAAGANQYRRLEAAMALDADAALRSCSWGLPQIMGDNYKMLGYDTVNAMVRSAVRSARDQLLQFVRFIKANGLADELQEQRWADFARVYNGPGYAQNAYDTKLEQAHRTMVARFSGNMMIANDKVATGASGADVHRMQVMQAQTVLNAEAYAYPALTVDGYLGAKTAAALRQFQLHSGLPGTGQLDWYTQKALGIVQG
jgi:hypothetical protein